MSDQSSKEDEIVNGFEYLKHAESNFWKSGRFTFEARDMGRDTARIDYYLSDGDEVIAHTCSKAKSLREWLKENIKTTLEEKPNGNI